MHYYHFGQMTRLERSISCIGVPTEVYALHIGGLASEFDTHLAAEYGTLYADAISEFLYKLALGLKEKQLELKNIQSSTRMSLNQFLKYM